jgi:hypothetical protein
MGGSLRRRASIVVLSVAFAFVGLMIPASAQAATVPTSTFTMSGDSTDYITGGGTYNYTSDDSTFKVSSTPNLIHLTVIQGSYVHWWYADFKAPDNQPLVEGNTYDNAQRYPFQTAGWPGLSVDGDGRGCNTLTGSFTLNKLVTTRAGAVTEFAIDWVQHCEGGTSAARGSIHWYSPTHPMVATTIQITAPPIVARGLEIPLTGHLATANGPVGAAPITVTRKDYNGTKTLHATTDAKGDFLLRDTPVASGRVTYTASFADDPDLAASQSSVDILVPYDTTTLSVSLDRKVYKYGDVAAITVKLGATHKVRTVRLYQQNAGFFLPYPGVLIGTGVVSPEGVVTFHKRMLYSSTFIALFAGDDWYFNASATKSTVVNSVLKVSLRGYITKDSLGYLYGHASPRFEIGVYPKRQAYCVSVEIQRLVGKSWRHDSSQPCVPVDEQSLASGVDTKKHAAGTSYRLRASIGGATFAGPGQSSWTYFRFK